MTPADKITKARAMLIMKQPFFGSLALRLRTKEVPKLGTAAVDGRTMYYDPDFVSKLTLNQIVGMIAHEVMHCAMLHHTRRGEREKKRWNKACDFAINHILLDAKLDLPDQGCVNNAWKTFTAEHIYTLLPEEKGGGGKGGIVLIKVEGEGNGGEGEGNEKNEVEGGNDPGGNGRVDDSPSNSKSPAETQQEETEWKVALAQALHVAKQRGKVPAGMERLVEELLEPILPWRDILRRFMTEKANDDFTWARPNRRLIGSGTYLPARRSEDAAGEMVVIIDTSGSIGIKELTEFASEISSIHKDVKPKKLHVIYCDAAIAHIDTFGPEDELKIEPHGGGGTSFRPPFVWIENNCPDVKCAIYLTDGYGDFPEEQPFPVMWAINNDQVIPPFGEHLQLTVD